MRASDRRRQLLETAADVFARLGYHGTTTAELARAAGVTEPVLYQHFPGKLELFATLIDEVGAEVIHAWQRALEGVSDPQQRLSILLAGNPAAHQRGSGVYRVIFHAMTESRSDDDILKPLRRHLRQLHTFIAGELKAAQAAGIVRRDFTAPALAWTLMHLAIGFGMVGPLKPSGHQKDAPPATVMQIVASMLQP